MAVGAVVGEIQVRAERLYSGVLKLLSVRVVGSGNE